MNGKLILTLAITSIFASPVMADNMHCQISSIYADAVEGVSAVKTNINFDLTQDDIKAKFSNSTHDIYLSLLQDDLVDLYEASIVAINKDTKKKDIHSSYLLKYNGNVLNSKEYAILGDSSLNPLPAKIMPLYSFKKLQARPKKYYTNAYAMESATSYLIADGKLEDKDFIAVGPIFSCYTE